MINSLKYMDIDAKNDPKVVFAAVEHNWKELQYASEILLNDPVFIRNCLFADPRTIKFTSIPFLYNNYDLAYYSLTYIKDKQRFIKRFIPQELYNKEDFIVGLIRHMYAEDWFDFVQSAKPDLLNNRFFCIQALLSNGKLLEFLPKEYSIDPEVIQLLVNQDKRDYSYLDLIRWEDVLLDKSTAAHVLELRGELLSRFSSSIKNNKDLVKIAVRSNGKALSAASNELLNDREFILEIMQLEGSSFIPEAFRDDEEIVSLAVSKDSEALQWASDRLRADFNIVQLAVENCIAGYRFAHESIRAKRDLTLDVIEADGFLIKFVPAPLNKDREIVLTAMSNLSMFADKKIFNYVPEEMRNDREIIYALLSNKSIDILECVPSTFDDDPIIQDLIKSIRQNYFDFTMLLKDKDESWWDNS